MIVVTVGTSDTPFDRLLAAVEPVSSREECIAQVGNSTVRPAGATCVSELPFEQLLAHMREARAVVTHGGVGSIMSALSVGKRPFVVPRLRRLGEAVDDHQLVLGRRLAEAGLVTLIEDAEQLAGALANGSGRRPPAPNGGVAPLAAELRDYLSELLSSAPDSPRSRA